MSPKSRVVKSRSNGPLIAAAQAFAARFPEVVLLQPRHLAGEGMPADAVGSVGLHRLTLIQIAMELARPRLAELGLAPLSTLGREALSARVVYTARERNRLKYFHPVAGFPGFPQALYRTLLELRLAKIRPEQLTGDLAKLLAGYEAELADRALLDLAGLLDLACEAARESHPFLGLPLVLLDAPLESLAHRDLFAHLADRAPEVLAAVHAGEEHAERILDVQGETIEEASSSLEHLRRFLFSSHPQPIPASDDRFEFFSAPGEGLEGVEIARRILKLAEGKVSFDQIAILLRNPDRYQPMIEEALRRAAIPAWFSRGVARPHPAGRALLALLGCAAEKLSASRFAEYLSLGQAPAVPSAAGWTAPEDEVLAPVGETPPVESEPPAEQDRPMPRAWERLLVDAAVIGGRDRWERRLNGLEAEFELQDRDVEPLRNLKRFALPLINALDGLPAAAQWSVWMERLGELARLALREPEPVLAVLAELAPMGEVGPVTLEEVTEVLDERLRFLRRDPPARRWGRVFVGSVEDARAREFSVVFLPGLAEGLFPQKALEDPLLLDEFRKQISADLPLRPGKVADERMLLHLAVAAAGDRLVVSYPRMEVAEARPRVPSFYALELPRAMEGSLPELKEFERRAREAAPARLNWPAPREAAQAIDDAEYDLVAIAASKSHPGGAHYLVSVNPNVARSLRARWSRWRSTWKPVDGLIVTDPATLAALQDQRLTARAWSPSSLEQFAVCPYKFALQGIYRLRPREEAEALEQLDPRTRGGLFHAVQKELFDRLKDAAMLPVSLDRLADALKLADAALDRVAAEYAERLAPAIPRVWKSEIEDLRTDLRGWLQHAAANDDEWVPAYFELPFEEVDLAEGVHLRGRIDLVEKHSIRDAFRVTDHKTGKRPDTIPRWVGGGKSLQPLLYALAVEHELNGTVEAGRLFYATQRGGYTPVEIKLDPRARQFLGRLLANIDGSIANGFLPPAPEKEACGFCDYRIVCGPYEERRLTKKDRRDERLEALTEIRGMA